MPDVCVTSLMIAVQIQLFFENVRQLSLESDLIRNEAAAYIDDLRSFKLPTQPRAKHWYAVDESRQRVLVEARAAATTGPSYETLAEVEHLSGAPEAAEHMLQAAGFRSHSNALAPWSSISG